MTQDQDQDQINGIFDQLKNRFEKNRKANGGTQEHASLDFLKKRQKMKLHSLNDLTTDMVLSDY